MSNASSTLAKSPSDKQPSPVLSGAYARRLSERMQGWQGFPLIAVSSDYESVQSPLLLSLSKRVRNAGGFVTWTSLDSMSSGHALDSVDDMISSCLVTLRDKARPAGDHPTIICQHVECVHPAYRAMVTDSLVEAASHTIRVVLTCDSAHADLLDHIRVGLKVSPDEFARAARSDVPFQDAVLHPFMTVREAAWVLHLSESTVYTMIDNGTLADCVVHVGSSLRLVTRKLLAFAQLDHDDVTFLIRQSISPMS